MSAVVAARIQIGTSATPGNNITVETPAVPDGSFKIRKGAHDGSGAVLFQVDTNGIPSFPTRVPRTWQDVTASRVGGTTYTNNTGGDIEVSISALSTGTSGGYFTVTVGSITILSTQGYISNARVQMTFTVPPGTTYSASFTIATLDKWNELRP